MEYEVEGARPRGKPKKTWKLWKKIVRCMDWTWRMPWIVIDGWSRLGTIDDHYRCEWVNVSSGTGFLGCPGQNP